MASSTPWLICLVLATATSVRSAAEESSSARRALLQGPQDFDRYRLPGPSVGPVGPIARVESIAPADLASTLAVVIADAVARDSPATAADLIVQSLLQGAASTLATVSELAQMVNEVGCKPPLSTALAMASTVLAAEGRQAIIPSSLRSIDGVDVGPLAACWLQGPASGAASKDAAGR